MTDYLNAFSKLRYDTSRTHWPAETNHCAPHKPFLLLAVMDLISSGIIQTNLIELKVELMDAFNLYWVKVMETEKKGFSLLPFYHLKNDEFWHLVPAPGMKHALSVVQQIRSLSQFHQLLAGARLDEELFQLLLASDERDKLRRLLIETYFTPEVGPKLAEISQITTGSFQYGRELLALLEKRFRFKDKPKTNEQYHAESRSAAFRRIVVEAYEHTCAVCKMRLVTPEGRTAVSAAHIIPWRVSHNDDPRNGLALCGLHHWSFEQGIIGVTSEFRILVSPILGEDQAETQSIRALVDQALYLPSERRLRPDRQAFNWHRVNIFRAESL